MKKLTVILFAIFSASAFGQTPTLNALRQKAEQGDAEAQAKLGRLYAKFDADAAIQRNDKLAIKWIFKSVEKGCASGQFCLGCMYVIGQGVDKNEVEALKWFKLAAAQGFPRAIRNIGKMYNEGKGGLLKNNKIAQEWFHKAFTGFQRLAESGDAEEQVSLGMAYASGEGVATDEIEAVKWYRKAAEQGNARGQWLLGEAYAFGQGVPKDGEVAVKWFRKAAEQGDDVGLYYLGLMYAKGEGVPKNDAEAIKASSLIIVGKNRVFRSEIGWLSGSFRMIGNRARLILSSVSLS